jgi:hypothetical protein
MEISLTEWDGASQYLSIITINNWFYWILYLKWKNSKCHLLNVGHTTIPSKLWVYHWGKACIKRFCILRIERFQWVQRFFHLVLILSHEIDKGVNFPRHDRQQRPQEQRTGKGTRTCQLLDASARNNIRSRSSSPMRTLTFHSEVVSGWYFKWRRTTGCGFCRGTPTDRLC